jgi:hypothetical protein
MSSCTASRIAVSRSGEVQMPYDVLGDDHGVVDHEADRDGHRA